METTIKTDLICAGCAHCAFYDNYFVHCDIVGEFRTENLPFKNRECDNYKKDECVVNAETSR